MHGDDKICYCYNVPFSKLWHFARRHKCRRASQLSECLGAGTGCGWCIPFLGRIQEEALRPAPTSDAPPETIVELTPEEYAARRREYIENQEPRNHF